MPNLFDGTPFERTLPPAERRRWGRFYTAPTAVEVVLQLCLRGAADRVLDPSCGTGVFLSRAATLKRQLAPSLSADDLRQQVWGVEVDQQTADEAAQQLAAHGTPARIVHADFFSLDTADLPVFDCVVGNPPYTRQEWLRELAPDGDKSVLINRALGSAARLTQRAGLHAYFFVHAARFLREGGRLGFITSNSWLDVDYGAGLQAFLLNHFKTLAVIESQVERWFTDADVNTCLVILERCADANVRDENTVRFVQLHCPLTQIADRRPQTTAPDDPAQFLADKGMDALRVREVRQGDLQRRLVFGATRQASLSATTPQSRWGTLLRAPQVYLAVLERNREWLAPLKALAHIRRGYTAGANEFFYLSCAAADEWRIEAEFLRPLVKSPRDCVRLTIDPASLDHLAFIVHRSKRSLAGTNALRYIQWGESRGFHTRATCAMREPWYDLGEHPPAHLAWIKGVWNRHFCPRLPASPLALDQQLYGIELREPELAHVVAALLNSTWIALCAELGGRVNFGQGILWIAAYEAGQLLLPDPAQLSGAQASALASAFNALVRDPVLPVAEQIAQPVRHALDEVVFDLLQLQVSERQAIRKAVVELAQARITRARSVERGT